MRKVMREIEEKEYPEIINKKWNLSTALFFMDVAIALFTENSLLYLPNSREAGAFRRAPNDAELCKLKDIVFNLPNNHNTSNHANVARAIALLHSYTTEGFKEDMNILWGHLIKNCLNNVTIFDIYHPDMQRYQAKFLALMQAHAQNPHSTGTIASCYQKFLSKIAPISPQAVLFLNKFTTLAGLVYKAWSKEKSEDGINQIENVSMLLAINFLKLLHLDGEIFDKSSPTYLRDQSYFAKAALKDILIHDYHFQSTRLAEVTKMFETITIKGKQETASVYLNPLFNKEHCLSKESKHYDEAPASQRHEHNDLILMLNNKLVKAAGKASRLKSTKATTFNLRRLRSSE